MVVSRVGKEQDIGTQIRGQVFDSPRSLALTAAIIGGLGLVPGMPNLVFMIIAAGLAAMMLADMSRPDDARVEPLPDLSMTLPDLEGLDAVRARHVGEALQFRDAAL